LQSILKDMVITDTFIYLELQKTGCSHTKQILANVFGSKCQIVEKHFTYDKVSPEILGDFENKLKVGNIRNPWDWYVSLWAFGCQRKGGLYSRLTNQQERKNVFTKIGLEKIIEKNLKIDFSKTSPELWTQLYSDVNNHQNFNTWLSLLLSGKKQDTGKEFKANKISKFSGFLTYRYLKLYTYRNTFDNIRSLKDLKIYDSNENFMNVIIRNETLHEDLYENAKTLNFTPEKLTAVLEGYKEKTNRSKRNEDYRIYYTDESVNLVEEYENLIVEKYNYQFE